MLRARKSKWNSSSLYAAFSPAASRLGRGPRSKPQPQPASSTPEAPVQPVEMSVPDVTIPTPANQQIPVHSSSMLSSPIATNLTPLISVSDNFGIHVPQSIKEKIGLKIMLI